MTKQEAVEKTRELLELLLDIPDDNGIDILSALIHHEDKTSLHVYTGIDILCNAISAEAEETGDGEYTRRTISYDGVNIFQLDIGEI